MNKNYFKILSKYLAIIVITLIGIIIVTITLLFVPAIQNQIAKIAAKYVSKQINVDFSLNNFSFTDFNTICIENLYFSDLDKDTLIYAENLKVIIEDIDIENLTFTLDRVIADNLKMNHIKHLEHDYSNLIEIFPRKKKSKKSEKTFKLYCNYFDGENLNYKYKDYAVEETPLNINFKDVDVSNTNVKAMNIAIIGSRITLKILDISLHEKTGFNVLVEHGDFTLDRELLSVQNFIAKTPTSDFDIDVTFDAPFNKYKYFTDSVFINAEIKENSIINIIDIAYFTSSLAGANNTITAKAKVNGPVNDMYVSNALFNIGKNTIIDTDIHLVDTDSPNIFLDVDIYHLQTSAADIESIMIPAFKPNVCKPYSIKLPKQVDELGMIKTKGSFEGKITDFNTKFLLHTDNGDVDLDVLFHPIDNNINEFNIALNGNELNIGKILNIADKVSTLDANFSLTGTTKKFKPKTYKVKGEIDNINLKHLTLNNLDIEVNNSGDDFYANMNIVNENIALEFFLNLFKYDNVYNSNISIRSQQTNLSKLGLMDYDKDFKASFLLSSDIVGNDIETLSTNTYISDLILSDANHTTTPVSIALNQQYDSDSKIKDVHIALDSSKLDINLNGNFLYKDIPVLFSNIYNEITNADTHKKLENQSTNMNMTVDISENFDTYKLFLPNLQVNDKTHLNIVVSDPNNISFNLLSNDLAYNNININTIDLSSSYNPNLMHANLYIDDAYIANSKINNIFQLSQCELDINLNNDTAYTFLIWQDTVNNNDGQLLLMTDIKDFPNVKFDIVDSMLMNFKDNVWIVDVDDFIEVDSNRIHLDNFRLEGSNAKLIVDGNYSKSPDDTITADIQNIDLKLIKPFIPEKISPNGTINGNITHTSNNNKPVIYANVEVDSIGINDIVVGDIFLNSNYDNSNNMIIVSSLLTKPNGHDTILSLDGNYYPYDNNSINGNVDIQNIELKTFNSLTNNFLQDLNGSIHGNIDISNNLSEPIAVGNLNLDDIKFSIGFTNTSYHFSNTIDFTPQSIIINNFKLYDTNDNYFDVRGTISHNYWKDFEVNLNSSLSDFTILNNQGYSGNIIHGKTILSGDINAQGDFKDLEVNADLRTNSGTNVTLELTTNKTASEKSFVNFVAPYTDNTKPTETKAKSNGSFSIDANAAIDNFTQININLPYSMGDMSINGNGNIKYTQEKNGNYNLIGDYVVASGSFNFNFQNFVRRNFTISNGGTIIFNGDPMNATLDLQAVYQTRASLQGIPTITDPAIAQQRVAVNCIINFSGSLYDPTITFGLEAPNIDEDLKSMIFSAIDLNDQTVLNQQVFSLLILKSFNFSIDDSFINTTGGVSGNYMSIISGQLSQWISQIYNGFDLGVNYNPGNELTPEEFEVYLKTQFFDDRLIIDGNFGVQNNTNVTQDNNSNIIGDVQIEYKITKDGKLRVKAFNRTNQFSIIENNSNYTQGIGVSYSTEFDKFSDLFNRKRRKRIY